MLLGALYQPSASFKRNRDTMNFVDIVCDGSDLTGIRGAEQPDILIIGGYSLGRQQLVTLLERVREIKHGHGLDPDFPVKWNLRDLDNALKLHELEFESDDLTGVSELLRGAILEALAHSGATLFVSIIEAHSNRRQTLGRTRKDRIRFSFGNLLQRVGLHCRSSVAPRRVEVILDWPENGTRDSFVAEYLSGWKHGRTNTGPTATPHNYNCGPLRDLGFAPSPTFSVTGVDPRLQLADMVVGVGREFIEYALNKKQANQFGVRQAISLLPRFHADNNGRILGRGLSVSPRDSDLKTALQAALARHGRE